MFRLLSIIGILTPVVAILGHYIIFGPHHREVAGKERTITRFSFVERVIHFVTLISFGLLAGTGFGASICAGRPMSATVWLIHVVTAPVFGVAFTLAVLRWAENCRFSAVDWKWALKAGGYLGYKGHVDAERFNGGQKGFFWAACGLTVLIIASGILRIFPLLDPPLQEIVYHVHRFASLFMVMTIIAHAYLGSLANPGTIWTLISGKVSPQWAELHHSIWWKKISGKK